jgi:translation initiation factor 2 subunit 3
VNEKLIPEVNIGMVGHVSHGKTTLTEALTGKITLTHSEELKRGITIRLGYADATFYKCKNGHYGTSAKCKVCFEDCEILRTVSFIDAPGHETLMATVLTGASLMDGALLVIAANEKTPQPQTREHLTALEVAGIKNVIIIQNKIDLITKERALENYEEIKNFIKGSEIESAPIIPVSSQQKLNIDSVIEAIQEFIPTPKKDPEAELRMYVARSFDVNKPGKEILELSGGVLGGAITSGKLKIGDEISIRPGIRIGNKYKPLKTKVIGLKKGGIEIKEAKAGGLLGVMTELDPSITKSDLIVGNVVSSAENPVEVRESLQVQIKLLQRVVGDEELKNVQPLKLNEELLINVGTARTVGIVSFVKKDKVETKLKIPVVAEKNNRIAISRLISGRWRLIGYGTVI